MIVSGAEDTVNMVTPAGLGVGATPQMVVERYRQWAAEEKSALMPTAESDPDFPLAQPRWEKAFEVFIPAVREAIGEPASDGSSDSLVPAEEALPLDDYLLAHPVSRMSFEGDDLRVDSLPDSPPVSLEEAEDWAEWLGMDFSGTVEYSCQFYIPKAWAGDAVRLEVGDIAHAAIVLIDGQEMGHLILPPWRLLLDPIDFGAHTITIRVTNSPANAAAETFGPEAKNDPNRVPWLKTAREAAGGGLRGPVVLRQMSVAARE